MLKSIVFLLKKKDGFTLIETVVAIAMVTVLTGVVLAVFINVNRAYNSVVEMNLVKLSAENALDFIKESVKNAGELEIIDNPAAGSGETAIWCDKEKLYYKYADNDTAVYMENTRFDISFSAEDRLLGIKLAVLGEDFRYELNSAISLENLKAASGSEARGIRFN